jgi:Zn-dependent peptidase ImmA (M78 family)/DNA-binding XRE family transcriptional regulator
MGHKNLKSTSLLFSGRRLTLARLYNELTKSELAKRVQVSPAAIGQYESEKTQPSADVVAKLAWELRFPVSFFEGGRTDFPLKRSDAHFRSLASASKKKKDKLLVKAEFAIEFVNVLERYVDIPRANMPNMVLEGESMEDMEYAAEQARSEWGLGQGPIPDFIRLLEKNGFIVLNLSHEDRKVDAFSTTIGGRPLIFLNDEHVTSRCRQRLNAAHELGHLGLHQDLEAGSQVIERQAYRFGAAMLMPKETIIDELPRRVHWNTLLELKLRWQCSMKAILKRAVDLGTVSENQYRRGLMHYNAEGWNSKEPGDDKLGSTERPLLMHRAIELLQRKKGLDITDYAEALRLEQRHLQEIVGRRSEDKLKVTI